MFKQPATNSPFPPIHEAPGMHQPQQGPQPPQGPFQWSWLNNMAKDHPYLTGLGAAALPMAAMLAMQLGGRGDEDEDEGGGMDPFGALLGSGLSLGVGGMMAKKGLDYRRALQQYQNQPPRYPQPNPQQFPLQSQQPQQQSTRSLQQPMGAYS